VRQGAFYGSQVTSNMVADPAQEGTVKSMQEAMDRGYVFCVPLPINHMVQMRYSGIQTIPVMSWAEGDMNMEAGNCLGIVRRSRI
jgi:hypothetical protein